VNATLGDSIIRWAEAEDSVLMLTLIGSRTRPPHGPASADAGSDWDFQVVTERPELFASRAWCDAVGLKPLAHTTRMGRLGSSRKVTAVFEYGSVDLVVLPATQVTAVAALVRSGQHVAQPAVLQALTDLSSVLQGGWRVLKGEALFGELYRFVATEVSPARLSDAAVLDLAEGFVCDYVATRVKLERGELQAARRWLHDALAEVNFQLLHELRQREGRFSMPDARRLERWQDPRAASLDVGADHDVGSLKLAVERSASALRELMGALVGDRWRWPLP
jgi:hypothetical protein